MNAEGHTLTPLTAIEKFERRQIIIGVKQWNTHFPFKWMIILAPLRGRVHSTYLSCMQLPPPTPNIQHSLSTMAEPPLPPDCVRTMYRSLACLGVLGSVFGKCFFYNLGYVDSFICIYSSSPSNIVQKAQFHS